LKTLDADEFECDVSLEGHEGQDLAAVSSDGASNFIPAIRSIVEGGAYDPLPDSSSLVKVFGIAVFFSHLPEYSTNVCSSHLPAYSSDSGSKNIFLDKLWCYVSEEDEDIQMYVQEYWNEISQYVVDAVNGGMLHGALGRLA
jgi:hypothetical protein